MGDGAGPRQTADRNFGNGRGVRENRTVAAESVGKPWQRPVLRVAGLSAPTNEAAWLQPLPVLVRRPTVAGPFLSAPVCFLRQGAVSALCDASSEW